MPTDLDPIAVLARTDPAAAWPVPLAPPLAEVVAAPGPDLAGPTGGHRRERLLLLAAAGLLVVLLAGAAVVLAAGDDASAPPATEPPPTTETFLPEARPALLGLGPGTPAGPELLALAEVAEADTTPVPEGVVAYSRRAGMGSQTTVEDGRATDITYTPHHGETWIEADGTLHQREGAGPPIRPDDVIQVDRGLALPEGEIVPFDAFEGNALERPVGSEAVRTDLLSQQGGAPEGRAALERFADVLGRQPLTGADRGALYRALATVDGIESRGEVRDRAGRTGVAFSYTTDDSGALSETIVVVDPGFAGLLQVEDVMLEGTVGIPIDEPLVQSYSVVLEVSAVGAVGERPG